MSVLLEPGQKPQDELIKHPFDPYWDAPLTRREAQRAINKLAMNDGDLNAMCDTLAIIGNFLCEKTGVTREELDVYVQKKKLEVVAWNQSQEAKRKEEADAQSNG